MSLSMEDCGRAVKYVIDSGAFDEIRRTLMDELKQSQNLRAAVLAEVEKSATLNGNSTDKRPKETKQILDDLNKELKSKLNDIASKTAWDILTNSTDSQAAKDLERKVHEALNRLAEERELQLQQQQKQQSEAAPAASTPAAGPARQPSSAGAEALGGGAAAATTTATTSVASAFLPPARPSGAAPVTASLAPATQARESQQPQPQQRPAPRYGLVGQQ